MNVIQDILTYPVRGKGKYVLALGAALSVVSDLVSLVPMLGLIAWFIIASYFCAVYFQIIETTATGGAEAPEFPDTADLLNDMILPFLKVCGVLLLSFLPWMAWVFLGDSADHELAPLISLVLFGLGAAYFPMAMLAVVVLGYFGAMFPHIVLPAIARAGLLYWLAVFVLFILYAFQLFVAGTIGGVLVAGSLAMALVGMFTLMTNGRILGIIYRERREAMNWI